MVEGAQPQDTKRKWIFPCNNAIDWYVKMTTDSPMADPKVEMLSELCADKDAMLE